MSNGDGPQSLGDWISYLHTAAQVKPGHPDYADARDAIAQALRHINALHVGETMQEATADETVGTLPAALAAAAHGASLGTGELIAGVSEMPDLYNPKGKGFTAGAQQYREGLGNVEASAPVLAPAVELGAGSVLPAARLGAGLAQGVKAGVPLGIKGAAKLVGQRGLEAAVPGGIAGFSSGGADPGDLAARLVQGGKGATMAALLAGLTTAGAIPRVRKHVETAADVANAGVMRELQKQRLRNAQGIGARWGAKTEPAAAEVGEPPPELPPVHPDVAQAVADFEEGKISGEDLKTAIDVAGGRTPAEPARAQPISPGPPGSGLRAATGTGGTLPRYYRGGQQEQAQPPPPASSPRLPDMAIRLENPALLAQFPLNVIRDRLANEAFRQSLRPTQLRTVTQFLEQAEP